MADENGIIKSQRDTGQGFASSGIIYITIIMILLLILHHHTSAIIIIITINIDPLALVMVTSGLGINMLNYQSWQVYDTMSKTLD